MASDTAPWSLDDIAETKVNEAFSEFEKANAEDIEKARADGKARAFPLEKGLEDIMKELARAFLRDYPTATLRVADPVVAFTSRKHVPLPGFEEPGAKTGYFVLKSSDLKAGSIQWGEDLKVIREGFYIPFGVK